MERADGGCAAHPDGGLSEWRTTLSWNRTALATVTVGAIVARVTFDRLGAVALLSLVAGGLLGCALMRESFQRRRETSVSVGCSVGGPAALMLSAAAAVACLVEVFALLSAL